MFLRYSDLLYNRFSTLGQEMMTGFFVCQKGQGDLFAIDGVFCLYLHTQKFQKPLRIKEPRICVWGFAQPQPNSLKERRETNLPALHRYLTKNRQQLWEACLQRTNNSDLYCVAAASLNCSQLSFPLCSFCITLLN